jgi:hypothetical protein
MSDHGDSVREIRINSPERAAEERRDAEIGDD